MKKFWFDIKAAVCVEACDLEEANEKVQMLSEWYDIETTSEPREDRWKI
jgi:hypothetical protein